MQPFHYMKENIERRIILQELVVNPPERLDGPYLCSPIGTLGQEFITLKPTKEVKLHVAKENEWDRRTREAVRCRFAVTGLPDLF